MAPTLLAGASPVLVLNVRLSFFTGRLVGGLGSSAPREAGAKKAARASDRPKAGRVRRRVVRERCFIGLVLSKCCSAGFPACILLKSRLESLHYNAWKSRLESLHYKFF